MSYCLGDACHNTFALFDRLDVSVIEEDFLRHVHTCLIEEKRDDALILYDGKLESGAYTARMLVLGLDGTVAEFCGNGSRVCAAYLFAKYPHCKSFFLSSRFGIHPLKKYGSDIYSIKLPPANFALNTKFIADTGLFKSQTRLTYVDMLEPHLIVQEELTDEELLAFGREINQKKDLFPYGINVNAWSVCKNDHLFVKTYERGVQRLTQSCGTGSMSCAAYYKSKGAVSVSTPGGPLEIILQDDGIELKGPAFFFCTHKTKIAG